MQTQNGAGDTPNNPTETPEKNSQASSGRVAIRPGAKLVILILILAGIGYTLNRQDRAVRQELAHLQETTARLSANQQALQDTLTRVRSSARETEIALKSEVAGLGSALQTALKQRLYQEDDWILRKARYYLELAQMNATWSNNQQTTVALLHHADDLLAPLHRSALQQIRNSIASEIAAIEAWSPDDITGMLSTLDAAITSAQNLPLNDTLLAPSSSKPSPQQDEPTSRTWRERLRDSVGLLEKLVVVRHWQDGIKPLPTPAEESLIRETININLEEAQWAVLRGNSAIFQGALASAIAAIKTRFNTTDPATKALLARLQTLKDTPLAKAPPVPDTALGELNAYLDTIKTPATPAGDVP